MGRTFWICSLVVIVLASGCATRRAVRQQFLLTSVATSSRVDLGAQYSKAPSVGVGPIIMPGYLRRAQIVTRDGNRLKRSQRHLWAENLEDDFARVLAENLAILIPTDRISVFPWADPRELDYSIAVQVSRFDRDSDDRVTLLAQWRIVSVQADETVRTARTSIVEPASGRGYDETVAAMSRALEKFSRQLVAAIPEPAPQTSPGSD